MRKTMGNMPVQKRSRQRSAHPSIAAGGGTVRPRDAASPGTTDHEVAELHRGVSQGLAYLHGRINATAGRTFEAASFIYALIELLEERNLISREEIDERKKSVAERLLRKFSKHDAGVSVQEAGGDKYNLQGAVTIDCGNRVALCRAACCKMVFPLSPQDIAEGVIGWDFGTPYVIAKDEDGYCRHFDRRRMGCAEHACRPVPCRVYDCRNDARIWTDFAARIVNPEINDPEWPHNLAAEERMIERTA